MWYGNAGDFTDRLNNVVEGAIKLHGGEFLTTESFNEFVKENMKGIHSIKVKKLSCTPVLLNRKYTAANIEEIKRKELTPEKVYIDQNNNMTK